ncbi:unnamed protein product [Ixodes persulcatus]
MVNVSMKIVDVDDINEERMDFRLHTYFEESWRDFRLKTSVVGRWRYSVLPERVAKLIWTPDVVFSNTKKSSIFKESVQSIVIKVADDGTIRRLTRSDAIRVRCMMTFHNYPMDVQQCHFRVSLMATPNWMTELSWQGGVQEGPSDAIEYVDRIEPLQFRIKAPLAYRYSEVFLGENYTHLLVNFTFERRLTASIVNTYIPSGLVVVLSWLSFWLDVHAVQGRITLGVTAILTLTTQGQQVRASEGEEDITDDEILGSTLSGASTVTQNTTQRKPESASLAFWNVVLSKLRYLEMTSSNIFDSVSRLLFPAAFVLFMISYWAHYLSFDRG